MAVNRTDRLNSLLREVISDVIRKEVKHPKLSPLFTVTRVEITKDLQEAKVYISVIGGDEARSDTLQALKSAKGFISQASSKRMVIRHFPELFFVIDDSIDHLMRIDDLLREVKQEKEERASHFDE